mmetsp:Transcript_44509/g.140423  ORF Transcript_44509/g.140423 Transcript_44509/m.140423 type:complete len:223 (-) Transcript_44509:1393-2061(-)
MIVSVLYLQSDLTHAVLQPRASILIQEPPSRQMQLGKNHLRLLDPLLLDQLLLALDLFQLLPGLQHLIGLSGLCLRTLHSGAGHGLDRVLERVLVRNILSDLEGSGHEQEGGGDVLLQAEVKPVLQHVLVGRLCKAHRSHPSVHEGLAELEEAQGVYALHLDHPVVLADCSHPLEQAILEEGVGPEDGNVQQAAEVYELHPPHVVQGDIIREQLGELDNFVI